jgi:MrcB-like, N-terminal domain/AAA domain (dynein-related subfamily)/SacI restriction endonuclease
VPSKADRAYERAEETLRQVWQSLDDESAAGRGGGLEADAAALVERGTVAQRYAVITQLLQKLAFPDSDPLRLDQVEGAANISSRSLARHVVVPFDLEQGAPLGGSRDPYVSQPLRRAVLDRDLGETTGGTLWEKLLDILAAVGRSPSLTEPVLAAALSAMRSKQQDLGGLLDRVLQLQESEDDEAKRERKQLIEKVAPLLLKRILPERFEVDGGGGFGSPAEVPWIRIADPAHSPSAREGWYVAYLFAADGSAVNLSLIQGVTATSVGETEDRALAVRASLRGEHEFDEGVDLHARPGGKGVLYERATALSVGYKAGAIPPTTTLEADLKAMLGLLGKVEEVDDPGELAPVEALGVDAVLASLAEDGIELDRDLVAAAVAAIHAGQHILLTGPPGTAKTSFAIALAEAAAAAGVCEGFELITATADWTSAETIGAYWPDPGGQTLKFERGPVLEAIDKRAWLIIDELNRADIDKAFGPLFTVLSGHGARLSLHEEVDGRHLPVEIVPPGGAVSGDTAPHEVAGQWRLIATLNTRDRDLLFNLSYALLRRFAVIDVPAPVGPELRAILAARAATGDEGLDGRLAALGELPERTLGPAILIDCGHFLRNRLKIAPAAEVDRDRFLAAAIRAFVLPQLDDLSRPQQAAVMRHLESKVLLGWDGRQVAELLAPTFQTPVGELVGLAAAAAEAPDDRDESEE